MKPDSTTALERALNYAIGYIDGMAASAPTEETRTSARQAAELIRLSLTTAPANKTGAPSREEPANKTHGRMHYGRDALERILSERAPDQMRRVERLGTEEQATFYDRLDRAVYAAVERGLLAARVSA